VQYVRCDACGAKALFAASRCPKCAHAFFLRNHRGQMIPLAHCRKCDTYYPRTAECCKWCGPAEPSRTSGRTIAMAGLAAALGAVIWFKGFGGAGDEGMVVAGGDTPAAETSLATSTRPPAGPRVTPDETPAIPRDSAIAADSLLAPPSPAAAAVPVTTVPAPPPPAPSLQRAPATSSWTKATAMTYINVRSGADRKSPVLGVITPNMEVELGRSLYGWRQVRAPGITGWADPRNFLADSNGIIR
jgi:hypothetical protein